MCLTTYDKVMWSSLFYVWIQFKSEVKWSEVRKKMMKIYEMNILHGLCKSR